MQIKVKADNFLNDIPKQCGVYRFYTVSDELLYVGKAINLYNRVKSYFQSSTNKSPRITLMVSKIDYINVTITQNESSALIFENNFIKSLNPRYNIIFRDDKSYPLIRLTKHQYPRVDSYRGKSSSGATLFGPYPSASSVKQMIDMIQQIFKLRTCSDNFFSARTRPCMLYQIKRCLAPCVNKVSPLEYLEVVNQVKDFSSAKYNLILDNLSKEMYAASDQMNYEKAAAIRDKINIIKNINTSQVVSDHNQPLNIDIVITKEFTDSLYIFTIMVRNGLYVGDNHFKLSLSDQADIAEAYQAFFSSHYNNIHIDRIYTKIVFDVEFNHFFKHATGISLLHEISGRIGKLYQMGISNLENVINNEMDNKGFIDGAQKLSQLLNLAPINRIECIDISHNQGSNAVASLVVYESGKIDNSKYRIYNLAEDYNGDDLFAMETILTRRFLSQELPLPNVLLVDGGRLQYQRIKNLVINLGLCDKIRVIAIFKGLKRNPKFDQVIIDDNITIGYQNHEPCFRLLQTLRDEAHRFAITRHRKKQVKSVTKSILNEIPRVGAHKRRALIAYFGSVEGVAKATLEELKMVPGIGKEIAGIIFDYFNS